MLNYFVSFEVEIADKKITSNQKKILVIQLTVSHNVAVP